MEIAEKPVMKLPSEEDELSGLADMLGEKGSKGFVPNAKSKVSAAYKERLALTYDRNIVTDLKRVLNGTFRLTEDNAPIKVSTQMVLGAVAEYFENPSVFKLQAFATLTGENALNVNVTGSVWSDLAKIAEKPSASADVPS